MLSARFCDCSLLQERDQTVSELKLCAVREQTGSSALIAEEISLKIRESEFFSGWKMYIPKTEFLMKQ